jgi:hypothetical protein
MAKLRTCTVMIYTDGHESRYATMRGPMRRQCFDAHRADIVGSFTLNDTRPDYRAMTATHATPAAPAVDWQA